MRSLLLAAVLTAAALAGPARADDLDKLWKANQVPACSQLDVAWAWAGLPPCECNGKSPDCPCAAAAKSCPVNGNNCACGCTGGKPCNCTQRSSYDKLVASLKVGERFKVYVHCDPPSAEKRAVRWDDYPNVVGRKVIHGYIHPTGKPWTDRTTDLDPPKPIPVSYRPAFQPFGGACRT